MLTITQQKQFDGFKTPSKSDPIWWENPPAHEEDPKDKRTPTRIRTVIGNWFVLVEQTVYQTFPSPEERAKAKLKGEKAAPRTQEQYRIHLLHGDSFGVMTLKIYRHQSEVVRNYRGEVMTAPNGRPLKRPRYFYSDSTDHGIQTARKSAPEKTRDILVRRMAGLFKMSEDDAGCLLSEWTNGH